MDEVSVYDDLPEFDLGGNIKQIEDENVQLKDRIISLEKELTEMSKNINEMKAIQVNLEKNLSELFKTAKAEIERKDRMISQLRSEVERILFNGRESKRKRDDNDNIRPQTDFSIAKKTKTEEQPEKKTSEEHNKHRRSYNNSCSQRSRSRDASHTKHEKHNRSKSRDNRHSSYSSSDNSNSDKKLKDYERNREKHRSRSQESESSKGKIQILDNVLITKGTEKTVLRQPLQKVPVESKHSSSFVGEPKQEELFKPDVKVTENKNTLHKKPKSNIEEVSKILLERQFKKSIDESKQKSSHSKTVSLSNNGKKEHNHKRKSSESEKIANNKTDVERTHKTLLKNQKRPIEVKTESEILNILDKEVMMEERAREFLQKDTIILNPIVKSKEVKHRDEKRTVEEVKKESENKKTNEKVANTSENTSESSNTNQKETVLVEANKINKQICSSPKKQKPKAGKPKIAEKAIEEKKCDNSLEQRAIEAVDNKASDEKLPVNNKKLTKNDSNIKDLPTEPVKVENKITQQKSPKKSTVKIRKSKDIVEKPEEVTKPSNLVEYKKTEEVVQITESFSQNLTNTKQICRAEHVTAESELESNENSPEKQKTFRKLKGIEETKSIDSLEQKTVSAETVNVLNDEKLPKNDSKLKEIPEEPVTVESKINQKSPKKSTVRVRKPKVPEKPLEETKPTKDIIISPENEDNAKADEKVSSTKSLKDESEQNPKEIVKVRRSKFKVNVNQAKEMREKLKNEAINKHFLEKLLAEPKQHQPQIENDEKHSITQPAEEENQIETATIVESIEENPIVLKELRVSLVDLEQKTAELKEDNIQTEAESRRKYYKRTRSPRKAINFVQEEVIADSTDSNIVSQIEANIAADNSQEPKPKRKYQRKIPQQKLVENNQIEQDSKLETENKPKRRTRKRSNQYLDINNIVDEADNPERAQENRVLRSSVKKPTTAPVPENEKETPLVQKLKLKFSPILESDDKSDSIHFSLNSSVNTECNLSRDENFPELHIADNQTANLLSSTPISHRDSNENALSVLEEDLNTSSLGQEENSSINSSAKKSKKRKRSVLWKILD